MPLLVEIYLWAFITAALSCVAVVLTLAFFGALGERHWGATLILLVPAVILWLLIFLWPLRKLTTLVTQLFPFLA